MNKNKLIFLISVLAIIGLALWLTPEGFFTLENLKAQKQALAAYHAAHPIGMPIAFLVVYIGVTALSLPGAAILTLSGGALFGFVKGSLLVSVASTTGATLAFLMARYLFRDMVKEKFGSKLKGVEEKFTHSGAFYLFSLRLVPIIPFFVINVLMALTPVKTWTFAWVSWLGMLAGTLVYVNAGTQLGRIERLEDILSPTLLLSFVLLAVFPYIARWALSKLKR